MKILTIGNFTTGWDGSICDEEHVAQALEFMGHEVIRCQREEKPEFGSYDIILISQWDGYPATLMDALKHLGKRVYWAFDHQDQNQEWHQRLIQGADLYLSKRIADSIYPNWQWLPQDFAPMFLDRYSGEIEKDIDVLFTGSYLPWATERTRTLRAVDKMFNLTIHSFTPDQWRVEGFKNVYGPVMDDALPRLIARTKINLSIDHTIERGYWSDRNAQIMCCGGFVMFRHVPMSETVFRNNINYFHSIDECLENIQYFLDVPEDRRMLEDRGYEYAQANLKVLNRVSDLLVLVSEIL